MDAHIHNTLCQDNKEVISITDKNNLEYFTFTNKSFCYHKETLVCIPMKTSTVAQNIPDHQEEHEGWSGGLPEEMVIRENTSPSLNA